MAETSSIEWTDATWNPITGCTLVSDGCRHCYAAALAATRLRTHPSRQGLARRNAAGEAKFTGEVRFNAYWLEQPLRWRRPRRIFVCAHGDLFHESVPDEWIDQVFKVMRDAEQHTFQILTKRPGRAKDYLGRFKPVIHSQSRVLAGEWSWERAEASGPLQPDHVTRDGRQVEERQSGSPVFEPARWPLPNVWLGVSAEDQPTADARIPQLLATPAVVRFVSAEPLLRPLDLSRIAGGPNLGKETCLDALTGERLIGKPMMADGVHREPWLPPLDWVIAGGESGRHARPMHPDWVRLLRDQCAEAGVPFLFKQWGAWEPRRGFACPDGLPTEGWHHFDPECSMLRVGKKAAGRLLDGVSHDGMPG